MIDDDPLLRPLSSHLIGNVSAARPRASGFLAVADESEETSLDEWRRELDVRVVLTGLLRIFQLNGS